MSKRLWSSAPSWVWPWIAMAGVAVTILPRLRWINLYEDQAILAGQAMQVTAGQVPYRDFFADIPPGAIFLYAGYFKLVGVTVVHQRLLTSVAMLLSVGLVAHIGGRLLGSVWGAAVALLWGVWLPVFQGYSQWHFWSVAFVLAMTAALLAAREAKRPVLAFVMAGLAASAALIMLQSSLPAVLAGLVAAWLVERRISRSVLPMTLALAAPGVVVLVVLGWLGALPGFFADTVGYTLQDYGGVHALPFPWQPALLHDTSFWEASVGALWAIAMHWLLAVVAPIGVAVYTLIALWRRRGQLTDVPDWLLVAILATGLLVSVVIVHMSDQNFWLSAPLSLLLVAAPLKRTLAGLSSRPAVVGGAVAPMAVIYLAGLSPMILGYALVCHTDGTGFLREVSTPNGSICTTFESAPIVAGAMTFSSQHEGPIAFMPTGLSLYQMTGRVPPVPVLFLVSGLTPPAEVARVEKAMLSLPVEWVVYYKVDFSKDLPNDRALHDGSAFAFDQFLAASYQRQDQDGLVVYRLNH